MTTPEETPVPMSITSLRELHGHEGGVWKVVTQSSFHIFDLDAMTVTRHAGPHAARTVNDFTRPISRIVKCEVGKSGYWTMTPEGQLAILLDMFWQSTTEIVSIERVTDEDTSDLDSPVSP